MSRAVALMTTSMLWLVVGSFVAATALVLVDGSDRDRSARADGRERAKSMPTARLVAATTEARLPRAPRDPAPQATTDGDVVRPLGTLRVFDQPGGRAFAKVPPKQFQETWLPVIDRRNGWVRVLLPSRPNGATGWLREARVETRRSPYEVRVHLGSRTLELFYQGDQVGTWTVAIGKPGTPTPTGRTFVLGSVVDDSQSYSPVILPLGSHSDTLDTYGGGPGTVALHGWPDASVFGSAVSHGCIRVPADALERLRQVPLGTLVRVDEQ
jgi:lipoprotein-anchoring transpeptidase ErfK/SrfK